MINLENIFHELYTNRPWDLAKIPFISREFWKAHWIRLIPGVQSADPDLKSSQVAVKGVFDPNKLVEYVYKRTGKHAVIVKQEPEKKEGEEKKDEKKAEEKKEGEEKKEDKKEDKKEGEEKKEGGEEETKLEMKKNEYYYYYNNPNKYMMEPVYAPQIFSDENPNACSVM